MRCLRWPEQGQQADSPSSHLGTMLELISRTIVLTAAQMGCYQEGVAKDEIGGKDVTAHIFECVQSTSIAAVLLTCVQVHFQRRCDGTRRSFPRGLPRADHILLEGAEQEEAKQVCASKICVALTVNHVPLQPPMVLQCIWTSH